MTKEQANQTPEPEDSLSAKEIIIKERKVFGGYPKLEVIEGKTLVASFASFRLREARKFRDLWAKAYTPTEKLQAMIACVEMQGTLNELVQFWSDVVPEFDAIEGVEIEKDTVSLNIHKGDKIVIIPLRWYSAGRDKDD